MKNEFEINYELKFFLVMKKFLQDYYEIYGPADDSLPSLLSNLGRCDIDNYMPPDPALWQMWSDSLNKIQNMASIGELRNSGNSNDRSNDA